MKRVYLGGAFLPKLAKHLALVACLMIVSHVAGRPVVGQLEARIGHSDRNGEGLSSARTLEKDPAGTGADSQEVVGRGGSRGAGARD
jgi:hypothetical protein